MNGREKTVEIKKVLLINPFRYVGKNYNIGVDPVVSRHVGQEIKTGVTFPIGLAYLGAMLLRAKYEIVLLDPIAESISIDRIYDVSKWADAIVMPFSPVHQESIERYFSEFRNKLRVLGGGVAPHLHNYIFKNNYADVIFKGEPEETIVDLVQQYPNISTVKGIIYRGTLGETIFNEEREPIQNLDTLPFPVRNFSAPSNYWDISFFGKPTAWILPTRGCPYSCIFCSQSDVNQRKVRRRSPGNIVDEIEQIIKNQKVRSFVFFDETFNLNQKYTISVCKEILSRDLKIEWWCAARPDLVNEEVARVMKASGCIEMRFGLESANDDILKYLGKDTSVEKMRRGIEITNKVGINSSLLCILGSKMESEKTIQNTMTFIRKVKPLFVSFNVLTPLPGSDLFETIKDKIDIEKGLKNFDILHTDYPFGKYSSDELSAIIKKSYLRYYLSFGFATKMAKELFKKPLSFFWIAKTLLKQSFYIYNSIIKR